MTSELSPDALRWRCDPDSLGFALTDELEDLPGMPGQERASEALSFALEMERPGYNVFALGPRDAGIHETVRRSLEERARERPAPCDWCYLANFDQPQLPRALCLPRGRGREFHDDMHRFVDDIKDALTAAFESDDYRTQRQVLEEEYKEAQEQAVETVSGEARRRSLAVVRTPLGFAVAPVREGKPMPKEVFEKLPEEERQRIQSEINDVENLLQEKLREIPVQARAMRERIRELNDETAQYAIGYLVSLLRGKYEEFPGIVAHLDALKDDVVANVDAIIGGPHAGQPGMEGAGQARVDSLDDSHPLFRRYLVNLFIDNSERLSAPVIYEDEPTFERLFGRVEHRAEMGTLVTDHHLIRPGALHRAQGGYLIVDAREILTRPLAWEGLKRVLQAGEIRVESMSKAMGLISTITLEPEAIPVEVKVVMTGERMLFYLLSASDPEFGRLFKVAADFDDRMVRDEDSRQVYARLVGKLVRAEQLAPFTAAAVARTLEYSARLAEDSERLSTRFETISDVLREADYWARKDGKRRVGPDAIERAIAARIRRLDRVRERTQEAIETGTIAIDTEGEAVGQVNGLSVLTLGEFRFGRPSRITARIRLGAGKVVDIEREVKLGGPIHSKGVLILNGFISTRYLSDEPLSLHASLVFEQSYRGVEGDSASLAEACALISAISEVPILQRYAVTGSIDQHGRVQAIGGVNEKIEGFFDICVERGLADGQGVLIPRTNVRHLMLDERVVTAVREGKFHVHAVETVDDAVEVLTGRPAGEPLAEGGFAPGTVNARVEERLRHLNRKRRSFGRKEKETDREDEQDSPT